jgi:hypothetical protein
MTIITGTPLYSPASIYGQSTNRQASLTSANAGNAAASDNSSPAGSGSSKTVADAIAAAASSASYDFATVAQNARTVLDAGVAAFGQTPNSQTTQPQWIKIFGGMDRRSLYAVASNQGGQFSPQEQKVAKTLMDNQLANAGNVSASDSTSQQIAGYTKQVDFLNTASPEEQNSASWAYSMADAQTAARMADIDSKMPQVSGGNAPLLNVLMGAMYNARASGAVDFGTVNNLTDITSQPWAKDYAGQIEAAFAATNQPGGSYSVSV